MDFKTLFCKLLGIILCVLGLVGCEPPCQKIYYPILPFTVYPAKDTIRIGDTLWVRSDITTDIKDYISGNTYQYKNFDFILGFALTQYTDTSGGFTLKDAARKFTVGAKVGEIRWLKTIHTIYFDYKDNKYNLLGYVVPKDTGHYAIGIYSFITGGRFSYKIKVTDTKCDEYFNFIGSQFNQGNVNKRLLDHWFHYPIPPGTLDKYKEWSFVNSSYYFYVKR